MAQYLGKTTIGNCALHHGDCFEILPQISDMDCLITDPPYGCTMNDWDQEVDLAAFWKLVKAACNSAAPFCIFCQMPFAAKLYMSNQEMFRYEWVYRKPVYTGFLDCRNKPLRAHELIYVFCERLPKYRPQMLAGSPYFKNRPARNSSNYGRSRDNQYDNKSGERFPTSILEVKHEKAFYTVKPEFTRHPTQKSVKALECLIKTYTNPGDIVLDPFMGSGSTGVAAINTGRRFVGIEQDGKWFQVAKKRLDKANHDNALLNQAPVETGKPSPDCAWQELFPAEN